MTKLPEQIHKRLASEFEFAATKMAEADDIGTKAYYFSVFYGEPGRLLNTYWDADVALLWTVAQHLSNAIGARSAQAKGASFPLGGYPDGFLETLDEVAVELAGAFSDPEIDLPRMHAALKRASELTYATTGNGAYLVLNGTINLGAATAPEQPS